MSATTSFARWGKPVVWFHVLVWALFFLPSIFSASPSYTFLEGLGTQACYLVYFGLAVYSNRFFFLPRLYRPGRRGLYFGLTFGLALAYGAAGLWLGHAAFGWQDSLLRLVSRFYFLGFIFAMIDAYFENQEKQRRLQQLEHQQVGMELRLLKAQVNPHFLFNTLNNLYALTLSHSSQAPAVVLQLAELMRYLFLTAPLEAVNLAREVQHLRHYVELERLRLSDRADITFNTQGDFSGQQVPPMLLIPFVENAFKHGVETATGRVFVTIDVALQGNELFFVVENSKPACPAVPEAPGTGLPNVQKRLALLFPGRYQLTLDNEPTTYRAILQLTL